MITSTALVLLMIPGVGYVKLRFISRIKQLNNLQFFLLWISTEKVCSIATMAVRHGDCGRLVPVVLLGLLAGFLAQRWKVHWNVG